MDIIIDSIWPHIHRDQVDEPDIPLVCIDFDQDGVHLNKPISIQFQQNYVYKTKSREVTKWYSNIKTWMLEITGKVPCNKMR